MVTVTLATALAALRAASPGPPSRWFSPRCLPRWEADMKSTQTAEEERKKWVAILSGAATSRH